MAAWVFDIIAVLLIVTTIIISAKKGFLAGLLSFVGWIVSALVAKAFCGIISNYAYTSFVKERIYSAVFTALEGHGESLASSYTDFFQSLPESIQTLLGSVDPNVLNSVFADPNRSLETVTTQISEDIIGPIVISMLTAIAFIVVFLICMLLVKVFVKLFKGIKKIPIIGPINTFLGGVIGAIEAVIIIYILTIALDFVTTASGGTLFGLTLDDFSNSYVFQLLDFRGLI